MKAIEQYVHVVLFIILYQAFLTFKSVDKTLVCDHSNESCYAVMFCSLLLLNIFSKTFSLPPTVVFFVVKAVT